MSPPWRTWLVVESPQLPRPLAVRLPNWVGDVCMALPALHALQRHGWDLHCYGRGWAPTLLRGESWRTSPLPRGLRAGAKAMANSGSSHALLLTNSLSSAAIARFAGLKPVGFRADGRSLFLSKKSQKPQKVHEVEAFHTCARLIDASINEVPDGQLDLAIDNLAHERADAALTQAGISRPFVVLAPLAVGTIAGQSKVWPHFSELCQEIKDDGMVVVACPSSADAGSSRPQPALSRRDPARMQLK